MYAKTLLFLAAAALAQAQTASQIAELNVIIADVKNNMGDYTSLATSGSLSLSDLPAGIMPLAMAVQTATDDSYTTLYSNVDFDAVSTFLTKLPWYSSRLEGAIESATAGAAGDDSKTTSTALDQATSSVAAASSAASSVSASLITAAVSSDVSGAAATETAYSFRNTTVTVCEATSCHVTYVTETVCNHPEICQAKTTVPATTVTETICTHPEICGYKNGTQTSAAKNGTNNGAGKTTAGLQQQTANGAVKAVAGLGAGALAAAALLL